LLKIIATQFTKWGEPGTFGHHLIDELGLRDQALNQLFGALFLTAVGVFIGANLLLLDPLVLVHSAQISLICIAMLLVFYFFSRQAGSPIWGLALTYGLMWVLVYSHSRLPWLVPMFYVLTLFALLYALRFLRVSRQDFGLLFFMAVIAVVTILGVTEPYTSFDMLSRLHAGDVNKDTLFHASIAAMIKNYGIASTGLQGLVETPYHTFSHVLMAGLSLISGLGVIEVYGVASWVFFAPILIFSITTLCAMLDRSRQLPLPLAWGLTAVLLVLMPFFFGSWAVWNSFFVSESYLVSLGLFVLGLAVLFKRQLSPSDLLLVLLLSALISNSKASVGLIFSGLWLTRLIFVRGSGVWREFAALMLATLALGWVVFNSAKASSGTISFGPLHLIETYTFLGNRLGIVASAIRAGTDVSILTVLLAFVAVSSFFVLHFVPSWAVIGMTFYRGSMPGVFRTPLSVYSLAAVVAGVLIVSAFAMPGGSAIYFSNVAFFVSLPGLVAMLATGMERLGGNQRWMLIFGVFLVSLLGFKSFYQASAFNHRHSAHKENDLINALSRLRNTSALQTVLRPSPDALASNPVKDCTAQPFVFPAVSERPWVGVINADPGSCAYIYYGYSQYGITPGKQGASIEPKLLPGMVIHDANLEISSTH